MPTITLTKPQKVTQAMRRLSRQCQIDCIDYGIKYKDIAEVTGVDPSAVSHQFKKLNITLATYTAVQLLREEKGAKKCDLI